MFWSIEPTVAVLSWRAAVSSPSRASSWERVRASSRFFAAISAFASSISETVSLVSVFRSRTRPMIVESWSSIRFRYS